MSASNGVYVSLEFTPNPNTLKYSVNRELLPVGAANFTRKDDTIGRSPLASKLFDVPGIAAVMIGKNFVTITKEESGDWDSVHRTASTLIEQHLAAGESVITAESSTAAAAVGTSPDGTEIEKKIREILDREIRPAVAMDGGDITLEKY